MPFQKVLQQRWPIVLKVMLLLKLLLRLLVFQLLRLLLLLIDKSLFKLSTFQQKLLLHTDFSWLEMTCWFQNALFYHYAFIIESKCKDIKRKHSVELYSRNSTIAIDHVAFLLLLVLLLLRTPQDNY